MYVADYLANHYKLCFKLAQRLTRSRYDAEEILHNVYVQVKRSNAVADNPEAYIQTTLRFGANSLYKKRLLINKWEENNLIFSKDDVYPSYEAVAVAYEERVAWKLKVICIYLLAAQYRLPEIAPKKRNTTEAVMSLRSQGKTCMQIARELGISRKGVIWQYSKIKRRKHGI